jgi:shikimate dehydrogenase
MTHLTALIGFPVEHSLSPVIHDYWLRLHNIDGEYKLLTTAPARLRQTILHMRKKNALGVNVTVPHKQAVMEYLDGWDDLAEQIGAVNTIINRDGEFIGTNTDAHGFISSLADGVDELAPCLDNVIVMGAGGASRAVIVALKNANAKRITITNRTAEHADDLAGEFNVGQVEWESRDELLKGATLLVNTTSLGMHGMEKLELSIKNLPTTAVVMDIVYAPLETELLRAAKLHGCGTVGGLGMLLYQAAGAFHAWHGVMPNVDAALRTHVLNEIQKRVYP